MSANRHFSIGLSVLDSGNQPPRPSEASAFPSPAPYSATNLSSLRPAVWLVVEDNDDDALLLRRAFSRVGTSLTLHRSKDARDAKSFLTSEGGPTERRRDALPSLILSDLHLPPSNGLELLAWVKSQPHLHGIPFVLLTSSDDARDRNEARLLGADDYLVKPVGFQHLVSLARDLAASYGISGTLELGPVSQRSVPPGSPSGDASDRCR